MRPSDRQELGNKMGEEEEEEEIQLTKRESTRSDRVCNDVERGHIFNLADEQQMVRSCSSASP
jgi:hypothetical protein